MQEVLNKGKSDYFMSDKKQTAVEWFVEKMNLKYGNNDFAVTFQNEISQAIQMENEQIAKAYLDGDSNGCGCYDYSTDEDAKQYYDKHYGK